MSKNSADINNIRDISKVPLEFFNRFAKKVNDSFEGSPIKEPYLNFELVIGSLFPGCYSNIQEEMRRQYGLGYKQGYDDAKNDENN